MALLISTNMYKAEEFKRVLPYVEKWRGQVGVEVFPMFHQQIFAPLLEESTDILSRVPISFHGPYYKAEHSAPQGTPEYEYTMELVEQTLHYSEKLNSRYMVFHHNNCAVRDKERMLRDSCVNYRRVEELFRPLGIPAAVENAGVMDRNNMLLDENEFVSLCRTEKYPVLIDIGHAHANGWDLRGVMERLKGQILAYHLHNNDGVHDSHRRIGDGTLEFESFMTWAREYTPQADLVVEYGMETADDCQGIVEDVERLLAFENSL